ncbi:MAG: caspase family protein [bacterium]|nr:caspase family protein [bacterium]
MPADEAVRPLPSRLIRVATVALALVLSSGCISIGGSGLGVVDRGRSEVRPRLQPPTGRIDSGALPSNADLDVDCDFDRMRGSTLGGYVEVDAPVRCPDEDVVRYLQATGFFSGSPVEDPPEVRVSLRFDPTATPSFERCAGSDDPMPAVLPVVAQFDPGRVAYGTREIGAIADISIQWEDRAPRFLNGTGFAPGVDCGPMEFMAAAERRFVGRVGSRLGEAAHAALEAALLGRVSERVAFVPKPSPSPRQPQNQNQNENQNPGQWTTNSLTPPTPPSIAGSGAVPDPSRPTRTDAGPIVLPPGGFGRYSALVIGVDRYDHLPALGNAVRDARAVGALLEQGYGYEVTTLENPGRADILKALVGLRRTLSEDDNLLIYYAGHGWLDPEADEGYWLPSDADREDPTNWISNDTITAQLRALRAKHVMVVADSCYSGKLVRGIKVGTRPSDYFARMAERRARVVMSSGGLEPVYDAGGRGGHSVFAAAFMAALEENEAIVDGSTIFSRIRRPVMANADQIPEYADIRLAGHDGGDFLFVRKGAY